MYDYANILFTGPCNLRCYECIGEHPDLAGLPWNRDSFPPTNIDALLRIVNEHNIPDLAFTGTNLDPQLYRYEEGLMHYVRSRLEGTTKLALHTNGMLAVQKMRVFNQYDKASVSWPSFHEETFKEVTHGKRMPDITEIIRQSDIPIKLSMLVTPYNIAEMEEYLDECADLGVTRVVMRKLKGRDHEYPLEQVEPFAGRQPERHIFGWPVYHINDMEVTICGFDTSSARGVYLLSDGRIQDHLV